jgi:hypothetical protein
MGKVGRMTPEEARKEAKQKLAAVDRGEDPADKRARDRHALTVAQLCDKYLAASKGHLKPSILSNDRGRIECHVKPFLGSKIVETLRPSDIERFISNIIAGKTATKERAGKKKQTAGVLVSGGPGAASRAAGMLRTILQKAVKDSILASNPARQVK